jgi:hypothetical protein
MEGMDVNERSFFLKATIRQLIAYTYAMIRHNSSNQVAKANAAKCSVQKEEVVWYDSCSTWGCA